MTKEVTPEEIMHWETDEYPHLKRGVDWYVAMVILIVAIVATAIIFKNYLFAVVIGLGLVTLLAYSSRSPDRISVICSNKGIQMNDTFIPYEGLDSFWVVENGDKSKVILKSKKSYMPFITVYLHPESIPDVRFFLSYYVDQVKHDIPLAERVMDYLGF